MQNDRSFHKKDDMLPQNVAKNYIPPEKIMSKNKMHALKGQQRAKDEESKKTKEDIMKKMI